MPNITLPDGKKLNFEKSITGTEVAEKISKSLGKQALVMSINGELKDLYTLIDQDCSIEIFTAKDPEGLEVIRHDTAHIMAMAVQELYPGTQVTIGPVIENGFFLLPQFSEDKGLILFELPNQYHIFFEAFHF